MKVRIGIVTHNRADILPQAIDSALEQDYENKEVMVIDDASSDATPKLRAKYPTVKWIRYDSMKGYRHARNEMMAIPGVDFFCSLDDDSWFVGNEELGIGMQHLADNPEVAAVGFDILDVTKPEPSGRAAPIPAHSYIGCGHILRTSAVKECGYYADTPGAYGVEEKDLSIQLLSRGNEVTFLPGVHVWHDKTMAARNVTSQHRSGVCNDMAFALRRCPASKLLWVMPAKLISHLGFALRFSLTPDTRRDLFDQAITEQIGRYGFFKPVFQGIADFLTSTPRVIETRHTVTPEAWSKYTRRSHTPVPWVPTSSPETVAISITTHNRKEDLTSTLEALKLLDPSPNEIIVCCDRCTDGTPYFLRSNYPQVRIIESSGWNGSIPSRDQILRASTSDIILSLDDDSYPIENDALSHVVKIYQETPQVAVVTFPQVTDEFPETLTQIRPAQGGRARVGSFTNSGSAIRRDVYLRLAGYPHVFEHAYEEPDLALQCIAAGYTVLFEPSLRIRHHYSMEARNELRTHRFHARNELWSAIIRCPFCILPFVLVYRVWRQLSYAAGRGLNWVAREPIWWKDALLGLPKILMLRKPLALRSYWTWINLVRAPERLH